MPAKDRFHDTVVRALRKAGWSIIAEQVLIILPTRRLWIDLQAAREADQRMALIEVKGFERMPSPIDYLAEAVGKYALYRAALEIIDDPTPLYLAVPVWAYDGILAEGIGQRMVVREGMRIVVFDPLREEIIRWIP